MTLNDIKKNALALMFTNYENDLSGENVDNLTDPEYTKYLVNMNAIVNRALGRIQQSGVLAVKRLEITPDTAGTTSNGRTRYDLATLASGFASIARIIRDAENDYEPNVEFMMEGDTLVIIKPESGEKYVVLYRRKPTRISITAASSVTIDVPDDIAELIPYFIKSELYEEDEPEIATQARNIFEAGLDSFKRDEYCAQTSVRDVFGGLV